MAQPGVKLLSDDRIILRKHEGKFWMYGAMLFDLPEPAECCTR